MIRTKALYNLLRLNVEEDRSIPHEFWAVEDLRSVEIEELFVRLSQQGLSLDREMFLQFANQADTPEDLADVVLCDVKDQKIHDSLYLIVFELWRRLLPEKSSLSIFCDELDHRITLYNRGQLDNDELIQDSLANLQEILDENRDAGEKPQKVFAALEQDCAHDLESFFYDYITDLLDAKNNLYASELIEGFAPYVPEPVWFDILLARLLAATDIAAANQRVGHLLKKDLELSPLFAILQLLSTTGDRTLFVSAVKKTIPLLETEEDFYEILSLVSQYYRLLDHDFLEQSILKLLNKRAPTSDTLNPEDPDLKIFAQMIEP